jgi:hypothetical protein
MTEDLQPSIIVDLTVNGSRFTIDWGGGQDSVHDWLGVTSVHDRLGGRVNEESNDRLEEMADSLVPDEDIMC